MEQLVIIRMSDSFERPNWDEYFMLQAELAKLRSNCITRQVGAVIVRNHRNWQQGTMEHLRESKIVLKEGVEDVNLEWKEKLNQVQH